MDNTVQRISELAAEAETAIKRTLEMHYSNATRLGSLENSNTRYEAQHLLKQDYRSHVERIAKRLISGGAQSNNATCAAFLRSADDLAKALVRERDNRMFGDSSKDTLANSRARTEGAKLRAELSEMARSTLDDARERIVDSEQVSQGHTAIAIGTGAVANVGDHVHQQTQQQLADERLREMLADVLRRLPTPEKDLRRQVSEAQQDLANEVPVEKRRPALEGLASALSKMRDSGLVELGKHLADWLTTWL